MPTAAPSPVALYPMPPIPTDSGFIPPPAAFPAAIPGTPTPPTPAPGWKPIPSRPKPEVPESTMVLAWIEGTLLGTAAQKQET